MKLILCTIALCLLWLAACSQAKQGPNINATAIAAAVQTVNAKGTAIRAVATATDTESVQLTPVKVTLAPNQTTQASPNPRNAVPATAAINTDEAYNRTIRFSGQEWRVKSSRKPVGPGPNLFSNSPESVWVDENDQLHLKIVHKDGKWYCAEVVSAEVLGYGSYQFKVSSGAASLDKNAVLGMFTWDTTAPQFNYREIDIELSRWSEETRLNTQFVIQPWDRAGNRHRFAIDPQADSSTHIFTWSPKSVQFMSFLGIAQSPDPQHFLEQWTYTGANIPPAGGLVNARINLWLNNGTSPSDGKEMEIILSSFEFIPAAIQK